MSDNHFMLSSISHLYYFLSIYLLTPQSNLLPFMLLFIAAPSTPPLMLQSRLHPFIPLFRSWICIATFQFFNSCWAPQSRLLPFTPPSRSWIHVMAFRFCNVCLCLIRWFFFYVDLASRSSLYVAKMLPLWNY